MSTTKDFVIPAAGRGSRLGLGIPKALVEIEGKTILQRQIEMILRVSPESEIAVVAGYRFEELEALVLSVSPDVHIVKNYDFASTGTSHSLRLARDLIGDFCILLPGDVLPNEQDLAGFLEDEDQCIGLTPRRTDSPVGVTLDSDGKVVALDFDIPGEFEWSGVAKLRTAYLESFGSGNVFESLQKLLPLRHKTVRALEIDTPEDLSHAKANLGMIYGI